MVVSGKIRANSMGESLTGRVLVLGKKQVGKSATIVRYTTGRFIGSYGSSTSDWLYRHWLGWDERRRQSTTIELLEQKDVNFDCGANLFNISTKQQQTNDITPSQSNLSINSLNSNNNNNNNNTNNDSQIANNNNNVDGKCWPMSWRVAMDLERDEKIDLLNRIQWAHAYVVIYAINDFESYEKAIRYLNLIATTNYGSIYNSSHNTNYSIASQQPFNTHLYGRNNSTPSDSTTSSPGLLNRPDSSGSNGSNKNNKQLMQNQYQQQNRIKNNNQHQSSSSNVSSMSSNVIMSLSNSSSINNLNSMQTNQSFNLHSISSTTRKPILLIANKRDLEPSGGRKVSFAEGRNLALRHQATFIELSVSKSSNEIEQALTGLFETIETSNLISSALFNLNNNNKNNNCINNNLVACERDIRFAMNNNNGNNANNKQFSARFPSKNSLVRDTMSQADINNKSADFDELNNDSISFVYDNLDQNDRLLEGDFIDLPQMPEMPPDININSCLDYYNNGYCKPIKTTSLTSCIDVKPPMRPAKSSLSNNNNNNNYNNNNNSNSNSNNNSSSSRYKNLKSSFKRASMAIVSSRTLLNSSNNNNNNSSIASNNCMSKSSNSINLAQQQQQQQYNNGNSYNNCPKQSNGNKQSSLEITLANNDNSSNVKTNNTNNSNGILTMISNNNSNNNNTHYSHSSLDENSIKTGINQQKSSRNSIQSTRTESSRESLQGKDSSCSQGNVNIGNYYTGLVSERLKRSIFKYKTRRKTVAFEPSSNCKSRVEQTSNSIDGDMNVLFINNIPLNGVNVNGSGNVNVNSNATSKWSTRSSTLSLASSNANNNNTNVVNPNRQQQQQQAKQTAAPNLDRSRSALNKGDKLYYRSIFGIQRPLGNKQKSTITQQTSDNANSTQTTNSLVNNNNNSYNTISSSSSGQSSPTSMSISPTSPVKATLIKEKIVYSKGTIITTNNNNNHFKFKDDSESGHMHLATVDLNQSQRAIGQLVSSVAISEPVLIAPKKQSAVRSVMNSLTRRPNNKSQQTSTNSLISKPPKQANNNSNSNEKKNNLINNQTMSLDTKKPIYASLFGGSTTIMSTPVIFKKTIEPISVNVARAEPTAKVGKCTGIMMKAGFCQQL